MGRINRKRKLSPSGSKARIVEDENGGSYAEITDAMGNRSRVSLGAMRLLQVFIYLFIYLFWLALGMQKLSYSISKRIDSALMTLF